MKFAEARMCLTNWQTPPRKYCAGKLPDSFNYNKHMEYYVGSGTTVT